jgi:hypothetical protein
LLSLLGRQKRWRRLLSLPWSLLVLVLVLVLLPPPLLSLWLALWLWLLLLLINGALSRLKLSHAMLKSLDLEAVL